MSNGGRELEEIVADIQRGCDAEANFRILFERYHGAVYRFFQRKGLRDEDCRDLAQEVFLAAHRSLPQLREPSTFPTWLYRIAGNIFARDLERRYAKKRGRDSGEEIEFERVPDESRPGPLDALLDREKLAKLTEAVSSLPKQMRRCVQLRVADGSSYEEIATVMGISVNTVKVQLHRARQDLTEKMSGYFRRVEI
jgi:RNA polymerase sigma-70 factor, ECF subfamily